MSTLESFPFHKWMLSEFLKDVVLSFLYHEAVDVRKAAVATTSHLMLVPEERIRTHRTSSSSRANTSSSLAFQTGPAPSSTASGPPPRPHTAPPGDVAKEARSKGERVRVRSGSPEAEETGNLGTDVVDDGDGPISQRWVRKNGYAARMMNHTLSQLLDVCVTDSLPVIRRAVLLVPPS